MMTVEGFDRDKVALVSGNSNRPLAEAIGQELDLPVLFSASKFANSESKIAIPENIRRRHVIIVQTGSEPVNDACMELFLMVDAAMRASASEITVVSPCFPYARQDRKEMSRVPISGAWVAETLKNSGANRVLTVDIHSEPLEGAFRGPWDNVPAIRTLAPKIRELELENLVVVAPDKSGFPRAKEYRDELEALGAALVFKARDISVANVSEAAEMIGEVEGNNLLVVDDMIDTAGSIIHASEALIDAGAKSIWWAATHVFLSGDAFSRVKDSPIKGVFITDSLPHSEEVLEHPLIHNVSIAHLLADSIKCIATGESIYENVIKKGNGVKVAVNG